MYVCNIKCKWVLVPTEAGGLDPQGSWSCRWLLATVWVKNLGLVTARAGRALTLSHLTNPSLGLHESCVAQTFSTELSLKLTNTFSAFHFILNICVWKKNRTLSKKGEWGGDARKRRAEGLSLSATRFSLLQSKVSRGLGPKKHHHCKLPCFLLITELFKTETLAPGNPFYWPIPTSNLDSLASTEPIHQQLLILSHRVAAFGGLSLEIFPLSLSGLWCSPGLRSLDYWSMQGGGGELLIFQFLTGH